MSFLIIPIPRVGQLNVKLARHSLFSERNGYVPTFVLFRKCLATKISLQLRYILM